MMRIQSSCTITQTLSFAKPAISPWKVSCWQPSSQLSILCAVASVNWISVDILAHGNANLQITHFLQPSVTSGYLGHCIILERLPGEILMINSLTGKEVIRVGDGWHDSMGHSAKHGTYTIFLVVSICVGRFRQNRVRSWHVPNRF